MGLRLRRFCFLALGLGVVWAAGAVPAAQAEWTPREFDDFFYGYPVHPRPERLNQALDCYIHLTATAAEAGSTEQALREVTAGRARFLALAAGSRPEFWQHAESLFPHLFWRQKMLLLEIFKQSQNAGLAETLNRWAREETDDDRRLLLEQTALALADPAGPTMQDFSEEGRWAVFFASGNTSVVEADWQLLARPVDEARSSTSNAQADSAWRESVGRELALYSSAYPAVRAALQAQVLAADPGLPARAFWLEKMAWLDLETGDAPLAQALLPALENLWKAKPEYLDFYRGALGVLNNQAGEVSAALDRLADAEFFWVERLKAYQAFWQYRQAEAGGSWGVSRTGGEPYAKRAAEYLGSLKTFRCSERFTVDPPFKAGDENLFMHQQAKYVQLPDDVKLWLDDGQFQSAGKISKDHFQLWTERTRQWTEVRDPGVRERMVRGLALDGWIAFLNRQTAASCQENTSTGRMLVSMRSSDYDASMLWNDAYGFTLPKREALPEIQVAVVLNPRTGQVYCLKAEVPAPDGRTFQIEKVIFDPNVTP